MLRIFTTGVAKLTFGTTNRIVNVSKQDFVTIQSLVHAANHDLLMQRIFSSCIIIFEMEKFYTFSLERKEISEISYFSCWLGFRHGFVSPNHGCVWGQ